MSKKLTLELRDDEREARFAALVEHSEHNSQSAYLRDLIDEAAEEAGLYDPSDAPDEDDEEAAYDPTEERDKPLSSGEVREILSSTLRPEINPHHLASTSKPRDRADKASMVAAVVRFEADESEVEKRRIGEAVEDVLGPLSKQQTRSEYCRAVERELRRMLPATAELDFDAESMREQIEGIEGSEVKQSEAILEKYLDAAVELEEAYEEDDRTQDAIYMVKRINEIQNALEEIRAKDVKDELDAIDAAEPQ